MTKINQTLKKGKPRNWGGRGRKKESTEEQKLANAYK